MNENESSRFRAGLAAATIAAQGTFVAGLLVLGAVEGHGYSAARHDISDLGALTAQHATAARLIEGIAGGLTIVFALLVLRPSLRSAGTLGAWLCAFSLPALDTFSDAFFRLDCRAADAGCSMSEATNSWHGKAHLISFAVAAVATLAAPFVLSRTLRKVPGWQDLAVPTRWAGALIVLALLLSGATTGTAVQGWSQRGAIVVVTLCVALLAARALRLSTRPLRSAALLAGH